MTQEEKAKAYEGNYKTYIELINRLEDVKDVIKKQNYGIAMDILCKPYPEYQITASIELKESEDERIRKELLQIAEESEDSFYMVMTPNKREKLIAWLEKQGEQKDSFDDFKAKDWYISKVDGKIRNIHYSADKVEPKFKVGDKIKLAKEPKYPVREIIAIQNDAYYFDKLVYLPFSHQDEWELVEQKPADKTEPIKGYDFHGVNIVPKFKKGDLIREKNSGRILTVKEFSFNTGLYTYDTGQFPITIQNNYEIIAQKPAWSEEDMKMVESIITDIKYCKKAYNNYSYHENEIGWLKSIKEKVLPQPKQEWTEDDESRITTICTYLQDYARLSGSESRTIRINEYCNWLKSLRPQNRWKPSDEQMEALESATENCAYSEYQDCLKELIGQLKKLRKE